MTSTTEAFYKSRDKVVSIVIYLTILMTLLRVSVDGAMPKGNDWKDLVLTPPEKKALHEFRGRVMNHLPEEFMKTEFYLIRWLRAKNLNLRAAQDMLFENVQWRKQNNISDIVNEDFSDLRDDFPLDIEGHDKKFRPIATMASGEWDLRAAALQGKMQRITRYIDWFLESIFQEILQAQKDGKSVTRARVLCDAEGINLLQNLCPACIAMWVRLTMGMEAHYPGFFEEITTINAPPIIRVGLEAVRPVMSKENRDSLKVFSSNRKQWMAYLDERINRNQRSERYGGTWV